MIRTEVIGARMAKRQDHFMPTSLLDSQLATLESLEADEQGIVVPLAQGPQEEVREIIEALGLHSARV